MTKQRKHASPIKVKPFSFWNCDMKPEGDGSQWVGDCPFCDKDRHLYVNAETGQWDCKVCNANGNVVSFLTQFMNMHHQQTPQGLFQRLAKARGLPADVLKADGLAFDGDAWMIPWHGPTGKVWNIERYTNGRGCIATAGCKTQLWGAHLLANADPGTEVWNVEGYWDKATLTALFKAANKHNVLVTAVSGAAIFKDEWIELFNDMNVVVVRDNDNAGDLGQIKAYKALYDVAKSIQFINWPNAKATGYDVRDLYCERMKAGRSGTRILRELKTLIAPKPRRVDLIEDFEREKRPSVAANKANPIIPKSKLAQNFEFGDLTQNFRDNDVMLNDDLETCLAVMCACVLSIDYSPGDPPWIYVVGPPASGKTLLLTSLRAVERCTFQSTLGAHSLVSGWKEDNQKPGGKKTKSAEDPSLIAKLSAHTLVIKDGTEILSLREQDKQLVFSVLRGAFDGSVERQFGNGTVRNYNRFSDPPFHGMGCVMGVTNIIHRHGEAALGERFLKFNLKSPTEEWKERVNVRAALSVGDEIEREDQTQWAMASFIEHCRQKLAQAIKTHKSLPRAFWTDAQLQRLHALVDFVAHMRMQVERDRYTGDVTHRAEPEMGTRLMKQLTKLGITLAIVLDKPRVDTDVWKVIRRVAMDTGCGFNTDIVDGIMQSGGTAAVPWLVSSLGIPNSTLRGRLRDMEFSKVVVFSGRGTTTDRGGKPPLLYTVTPHIAKLWRAIDGIKQKRRLVRKRTLERTK